LSNEPLNEDVRRELVAAIDDGLALGPDAFQPPDYGPYVQWREHTTAFIETVFGAVERQLFLEPYDPPPTTLARNLEDRRKRLQDLRDRPGTWNLQVNAEGLRKATEARRLRSPAEQIVEATERSTRRDVTEVERATPLDAPLPAGQGSGLVIERAKHYWKGHWNGDTAPLLEAARAAISAGPVEPAEAHVEVHWTDADGSYDLNSAHERLSHSRLPETIFIIVPDGMANPAAQVVIATRVGYTDDLELSVDGTGTDWPRTRRAFEAAVRTLEERAVVPEPEDEPAAVADAEPAAMADAVPEVVIRPLIPHPAVRPRLWRSVGHWIESHPALSAVIVGVIGIVVTVVIALTQ
jgi:hypothetical protein